MIGILRAIKEVHRLRVTNYFSMLDDDGIGELARMLCFADSEIIAVAVINQWLEEQTERPTPADLRRLVAVHNEARQSAPKEAPSPTWKCAACEDSGLVGGNETKWEWCSCIAASILRETSEEGFLDGLNARWRKLRLLVERPQKRNGRMLKIDEVYHDV
jgi:hypothetical protein